MNQSINLYPEFLRPKPDLFAIEKVVWGVGLLIILLCVYSAYLYFDVTQKKARVFAQQAQIEELQDAQNQIEQELLASSSSQILDQELALEEQRLRAYQQLIRQLSSQQSRETPKFSAYLEGLAQKSVPSTWLTRIALEEGGERFALEGMSLKADQVPQWVIQMKQNPVFVGKSFASLEMQQTESSANTLKFEIASHLEDEDESK